MKHIVNKLMVLFFLSILILPLLSVIFNEDKKYSKNEKRELAKLPEFPSNINSIGVYFNQFDNYYKDHYGFKKIFISLYSRFKYLINDSSSKNIIIGKDNWLFLNKGYGNPMEDYMNTAPMSEQEIKSYGDYIKSKSDWFKKNNMEYYFFMCPNKHSIYFEKLPSYISKKDSLSNFDRVLNYLKDNTKVNLVLTKETLLKEKYRFEYPLYSPKGTHWTSLGANFAQYELAKTIQNDFPDKITPRLEDIDSFYWETSNYDSSGAIIGLPELMHSIPKINITTCKNNVVVNNKDIKYECINNKNGLSALIFRDSYFIEMRPYLINYFKKSNFVWKGLTMNELKKQLLGNTYDIVVESFVERYLESKIPNLLEFNLDDNFVKDTFNKSNTIIYESKCFTNWRLQFQDKEEGKVTKNCETLKFTISKEPVTNIYLKNIEGLKNSNAIAYFEFNSTIETTFKLYYSIKGESVNGWKYSDAKRILSKVKIGANKIYIPLTVDKLDDSILFKIDGLGGTYNFKKVIIKKITL